MRCWALYLKEILPLFTVAGICGLAPNTSNNPCKNATSDSEADSCKRPHQWGYLLPNLELSKTGTTAHCVERRCLGTKQVTSTWLEQRALKGLS